MEHLKKILEAEITEKTKQNMVRKSDFVDDVQLLNGGIPVFSWIDISLTELCNRQCSFCPRFDKNLYPNQKLHMGIGLIQKIRDELVSLNYQGGVVFCGYGEPLLHPEIMNIIKIFGRDVRTEIVTNGDYLKPEVISKLYEAGLSFMCVSMYDGPEQVEKFTKMFKDAGIETDRFILRDRWHSGEDGFGIKLTNRGGVLNNTNVVPTAVEFKNTIRPCHYLAYSLAIDWNGDLLLCVQDWAKKVKLGNVFSDTLLGVWLSPRMKKMRNELIQGKRDKSPCKECDADGTLHGFNHVNAWINIEED